MSTSGHIKIYPAVYAGSVISTRESIRNIFSDVVGYASGIIELDFEGVAEISRAAAHELITQERFVRNNGGIIRAYNLSENVSRMIQSVSSSLNSSKSKSTNNNTDVAIAASAIVGGALIGLALYNFLRKS